MPSSFASAPGKIILFGEHAVVYGHPAIAIPLTGLRAKVTVSALISEKPGTLRIQAPDIDLDALFTDLPPDNPHTKALQLVLDFLEIKRVPTCLVRITSQIPASAGLGSGAAVAVATIRAFGNYLGHWLEDQDVSRLAFEVEKIHHGTPSGIDNAVVTYEKPIFFLKDRTPKILQPQKEMHLLVADSGISRSTAETVQQVRLAKEAQPEQYQALFSEISRLTYEAKEIIEAGNLPCLGRLMDQNQALLVSMDLSCPELDQLIQAARSAGAFGAKLSGGGKGGHMLALVADYNLEAVREALLQAGAAHVVQSQLLQTPSER